LSRHASAKLGLEQDRLLGLDVVRLEATRHMVLRGRGTGTEYQGDR
jgi:hypothetical protein